MGTDPAVADSDGDGFTDGDEVLEGVRSNGRRFRQAVL